MRSYYGHFCNFYLRLPLKMSCIRPAGLK
jgi:hypothetical protein